MSQKYKVVVLGEGAVGKTSLAVQFVHGKYTDERVKTVNATCMEKKVTIGANKCVLCIWDTAGQEMYDAIAPMYYRDSDGAILVYDVTSKESFTRVSYWLKQLREFAPDDIKISVVGNKIDRANERKLEKEKVKLFCKKNGVFYEETSAKENLGVEQMFRNMATHIMKGKGDMKGKNGRKKKLKNLNLKAGKVTKKRRKKCC